MSKVTVNRSDLIAVFELAILTEDRDPKEQTALNRVAKALDESSPRRAHLEEKHGKGDA